MLLSPEGVDGLRIFEMTVFLNAAIKEVASNIVCKPCASERLASVRACSETSCSGAVKKAV